MTSPSVEITCSELIRFDTSNPGSQEREAVEYIGARLDSLGVVGEVLECSPRRSNLIARVAGTQSDLPGMVIHAHVDTVPALPTNWTHGPFSGEIDDEYVWGRGAVDMKNSIAVTLTALAELLEEGVQPARDITLVFTADEETGGECGARFLVRDHRAQFDGCGMVVGEVGGFNVPLGRRDPLFLIGTVDKGIRRYELEYVGQAGHGSMLHSDNACTGIARVVTTIPNVMRTRVIPAAMEQLAEELAGFPVRDFDEMWDVIDRTGHLSKMLLPGLVNTVNVTRMQAGIKDNVVPGEASALLDCRFLPGAASELHDWLEDKVPDGVGMRLIRESSAVESPPEGTWFDVLRAALVSVEPTARVAPYVFSGSTDNKWFQELAVPTYGFTPLLLPPEYDFASMFHGDDERIPIRSLHFGVAVMKQLLKS